MFLGKEDFYQFVRSNSEKIEGGRWQCNICLKVTAHGGNMKQHFVTHHFQTEVDCPCTFCGRNFKNKNSLASHISQNHKEERNHIKSWSTT